MFGGDSRIPLFICGLCAEETDIIIDNLLDAESISASILDLKPDRVIIDHIQELNYGKEGISDAKLMVAAGQFKQAAKAVNANVTILSQVRDKLIDERYDSKVPRPHDFLYASDFGENLGNNVSFTGAIRIPKSQ